MTAFFVLFGACLAVVSVLMIPAGVAIALAEYVRSRSRWPHAGRIWLAFSLCTTTVGVGLIVGSLIFLLPDHGRLAIMSIGDPRLGPLLLATVILASLGGLGLLAWISLGWRRAVRRYGDPSSW
jgi:hypothetical protein